MSQALENTSKSADEMIRTHGDILDMSISNAAALQHDLMHFANTAASASQVVDHMLEVVAPSMS